jgi:hypothetical protein
MTRSKVISGSRGRGFLSEAGPGTGLLNRHRPPVLDERRIAAVDSICEPTSRAHPFMTRSSRMPVPVKEHI